MKLVPHITGRIIINKIIIDACPILHILDNYFVAIGDPEVCHFSDVVVKVGCCLTISTSIDDAREDNPNAPVIVVNHVEDIFYIAGARVEGIGSDMKQHYIGLFRYEPIRQFAFTRPSVYYFIISPTTMSFVVGKIHITKYRRAIIFAPNEIDFIALSSKPVPQSLAIRNHVIWIGLP